MMNVSLQTSLIVAIVTSALAVATVVKRPQTRLYHLFEILSVFIAAWHFFDFLGGVLSPFPWRSFSNACLALTVPLLFRLIHDFAPAAAMRRPQTSPLIGSESSLRKKFEKYQLLIDLFCGLVAILCIAAPFLPIWALWMQWLLDYAAPTLAMGAFVLVLALMRDPIRHASSRRVRRHLQYLFWGGIITAGTGMGDFLLAHGLPFPSLGNIALPVYLYFFYQAITKEALLDLRELVAKSALLAALTFILSTIYVVLVAWVGDQPGLFTFNTILASFVILVLYEPLKTLAEEMTERFLLPEKLSLQQHLLRSQARISGITDSETLASHLSTSLLEAFGAQTVSVYFLDDEGATYRLIASLPATLPHPIREVLVSHPLIKKLALSPYRPVVVEELLILKSRGDQFKSGKISSIASESDAMLALIETLGIDFCLPFMAEEHLLGFAAISVPRGESELPPNRQALLAMPLARQAGMALKNLQIYRELRERDRLAVLGEMSAGLAHEIRNPLGAMKGAAQCLLQMGEQANVPEEEKRELLKVIVDEVHRLDNVVSQFLGFARAGQQQSEPANLNDIIFTAIKQIQLSWPEAVNLQIDLAEDLPNAMIDAEQMHRLCINLMRNALDEMQNGGKLLIRTELCGGFIKASFIDTGHGIPPEYQSRIFQPFVTTKTGGTGLGLPICERIAKAHHGKLFIEASSDQGTTFVFLLPVAKEEEKLTPRSAIQTLQNKVEELIKIR